MWKIGVRVQVAEMGSPRRMLPAILEALGSGPWEVSEEDSDTFGNYASWSAKRGGSTVIPEVVWMFVDLFCEA